MPAERMRRALPAAVILVTAQAVALAASGGLLDRDRAALATRAVGALDDATAVALAADGAIVAAAFPDPGHANRALLRIGSPDRGDPDVLEMPGEVRALLFGEAGATLYAVVRREGKRQATDSYLAAIEPDTLKARRLVTLPPSAAALAWWRERDALVVACDDELRTFLLPDMRSGPLVRLLGPNLALEPRSLPNRMLVGKSDAIVDVDLTDPQGRDEIAIRGRVGTPAPVVDIALASDGRYAEVLTADRKIARLLLEAPHAEAPPPRPTTPAGPTPKPADAATRERKPPEPVPAPVRTPVPGPAPAPAPERVADAEPPASSTVPADADIVGRLTGPARAEVATIVVMGPDNLLREATRVRPLPDGRFWCRGLAPGTYRVILDAGGSKVVVASPPFRQVEVRGDGPVELPPFEVRGVR